MTKEEIQKQADRIYPNANVVNHEATEHQGFVKGALWMQEQLVHKHINEEELDRIALDSVKHSLFSNPANKEFTAYLCGFKAGYRKALEKRL